MSDFGRIKAELKGWSGFGVSLAVLGLIAAAASPIIGWKSWRMSRKRRWLNLAIEAQQAERKQQD